MGRMTALAVVIVMAMAIMSSSEAAACFLPPDDQRVKPEQLVARTGRIALAKVCRDRAGRPRCSLPFSAC